MENMVSSITWNMESKDCMYDVCPDCKGQELAMDGVDGVDLQQKIHITQWATDTIIRDKKTVDGIKEKIPVKITVKQKKEMEMADVLHMFQSQLNRVKRHLFNIKSQFAHYRELRRCMSNRECLIHIDFGTFVSNPRRHEEVTPMC